MTKVSDVARITFSDVDTSGVDENSPLELQAQLVWRTIKAHAQNNEWRATTYGGRQGWRGPFVMKALTMRLFPQLSSHDREILNGQISIVLKKTGSVVCLVRGGPEGPPPEWFVSNTMPPNLTVVAMNQSKRALPDGQSGERQTATERKLTPEESGETREPAEVTVSHAPSPTTSSELVFPDIAAVKIKGRDVVIRSAVVGMIYEQIATSPVPLTAVDLQTLTGRHRTTVHLVANWLMENKYVVGRKETRAERMVRGGGDIVRGKSATLLWPTPGPVPERTRLPAGIDANMSAKSWATKRHEEKELVVRTLTGRPIGESTTGKLASVTGLPVDRIREILADLADHGVVERNQAHQYGLTTRRHRGTAKVSQAAEPEAAPVPTRMMGDVVQTIHTLVDRLAARPAPTSAAELEIKAIKARVVELEAENEELKTTLARLRNVLAGVTD